MRIFPTVFALICSLLLPNFVVQAQHKAYVLKGQFANYRNQDLLLTYHNGIGLLLYDSLHIDANGKMEQTLMPTMPGIYNLVLPKKTPNHKAVLRELVLDRDSVIEFQLDDKDNLLANPKSDNGIFYAMKAEVDSLNRQIATELKWLQVATRPDAKSSAQELAKHKATLHKYDAQMASKVRAFQKRYPKHILTLIYSLRAKSEMNISQIHSAQDTLRYRLQVKREFFNDSAFQDPRMRRIPVFYDYLNTYFGEIIERNVDSLNLYLDLLARKIVPKNYALFQDLANYIYAKYVRFTPFVGSDILYYNLYTRYIQSDERSMKSIEGLRLRQYGTLLENNQVFMQAPNFRLLSFPQKDTVRMEKIQSPALYLLCFWDPQCYHCRKAMPIVDSLLFKDGLASRYGLRAVSITLGEEHGLQAFITQHHMDSSWLHLFDNHELRERNFAENIKDIRLSYGLIQTPTFYLLDRNQRIIAKNFSYTKIVDLLKLVRGF